MKILVTGGSGYLGNHVRRFFDADDFSRRSGLDVTNEYDCAAVASYDVIIHLAALLDKSENSATDCFRVNSEGTANLLRHARAGTVFIYASTKDVYGEHADRFDEVDETCSTGYCGQTALEWSKLMGERYVDYYAVRKNLRACTFRLSTIYARPSEGNQSGFVAHYVESLKRRRPIRLASRGTPVRDILHVDDLSRACRSFIDSSRRSGLYNVGGGIKNSSTLRDIVETVSRIVDIEPIYDDKARLPEPVPFRYISDLRRIKAELGWQPTIGMEEGLKSLL